MRAVVTGMIGTYPVGGMVWDYGQYALGLERLGWEVYYLEDTGWMTYDPRLRRYTEDPSYGVQKLHESLQALSPSLANRWHFRSMDGKGYGLDSSQIADIVDSSDILINVSGGALLRDGGKTPPDYRDALTLARIYQHFRWLGDDPDWTLKKSERLSELKADAEQLGLL